MASIQRVIGKPILNSRGQWTLEVTTLLDSGMFAQASVPEGESIGEYEATPVEIPVALDRIHTLIEPELIGVDAREQFEIDEILREIDDTHDGHFLGANTMLAVSLSACRAGAISNDIPLWLHIADLAGVTNPWFPRLWANMIEGGMHAHNNLSLQEYLVSPRTDDIGRAIDMVVALYGSLATYITDKHEDVRTQVGLEGGYAPNFGRDDEPLEVLAGLVYGLGLTGAVGIGIDAAGTHTSGRRGDMWDFYKHIVEKYEVEMIEDPFDEKDVQRFARFAQEVKESCVIVGDDLTATDPERIGDAAREGAIGGVIIKPNQIGTLSEALRAVSVARGNDLVTIISHRSGETNDSFIADLAVGVRADGLKLGAPARGERIAKYNRLLDIADEIGAE